VLLRRLIRVALIVPLLVAGLVVVTSARAEAATITTSGPLRSIEIRDNLQCQVFHVGYTLSQWASEGGRHGCGTFIALNDVLYGPPGHGSIMPTSKTEYTTVSQATSGSGTDANPYTIVTVVRAGTRATLTQTDRYVTGQDFYTTSVSVANDTSAAQNGHLYTAGECWPAGSYNGYGRVSGTSPACTNDTGNWFTVLLPHTGGNNYQQGAQFDLGDRMQARQPFADTCICGDTRTTYAAIGLSWPLSIPAGASRTLSWSTAFLPIAQAPLTVIATAHSETSLASAANGYRVQVVNPSSVQAVVHQIRVTLPAGFSYTGPTTGVTTAHPSQTGQTLTWAGPFTISPGGVISIDFNVTVSRYPGTYYLDATATADREVAAASHTAPITVPGDADLELVKTASVDAAKPGDSFSYALTVLNHGPSAVPSATIHDTLPSQVAFVSGAGCSAAGQQVTCTTGPIEPGGFTKVTVNVQARTTAAAAVVRNSAVVSSSVTDPDPLNNTASAAVQVLNQVRLSLTKTASASTVDAGGTVTFTMAVGNAGPGTADATLGDSLPAGLTAQSIGGPGASCVLATLSCTMTVAAGGNVTITLVARAAATLAAGGVLTNTATVTAPDNVSPGGATASASVTVTQSARLAVTKTLIEGLTAGKTGQYKITVTNHGPSQATGVMLTDTLPDGVTFDGVASSPVCTGAAAVPCTIGTLAVDQDASVVIAVHVPSSVPEGTDLTNTATAAGDQPNPAPAGATATITNRVSRAADLEFSKTSANPVTAGGPITYEVTVHNAGPSDAGNVVITDPVPAQVTDVKVGSVTPGTGNCGVLANTVTCTFLTVGEGTDAAVEITGTVADDARGVIRNTATVSTSDLNTGSSEAHSAANVEATTGLSASKVAVPDQVAAGEALSYEVGVTNKGPSRATGITLDDRLPVGYTADSATASNGATCDVTDSGGTVSCPDLGELGAGSVTVTIRGHVASSVNPGELDNTATFTDTEGGSAAASSVVTVTRRTTLSVTKTAGQSSVDAGSAAHWTILVRNDGPSDAVDLPVIDAPDPAFTVTGLTISGGTGSCSVTGLRCDLDRLPAHDAVSIDVTATVHPGTQAGVTITNCATANGETSARDSTGCAALTHVTQRSDLTLAKTSEPAAVAAGETVRYLLTVGNNGPSTATSVTLTDDLPAGLTFVPGQSSHGCTAAGQAVTCVISSIPPGERELLDVVAATATTLTGIVTNSASATADQPGTRPIAPKDTTVDPVADLAITKDGQTVYAGDELTWVIQVTNDGPSAASGAVIRSSVPGRPAFVRATTDSGSCAYDAAARTVTCHPEAIHPHDVVTVHVITRTPPGMVPPGRPYVLVEDPATVEYDGDPDPDNNTATAFSTVYALARLTLVKTAAPAPLVAGKLVTYHATVTNHGPSTATGISYADALPEGLFFDAVASDHRCSHGTSPGMIRCAAAGPVSPGGHVTFWVVAHVDATIGDHSDVVNDAVATAAQADGAMVQARAPSVVVRRVDLRVTKTASRNPVLAGSSFRYTIKVVNRGPSAATRIGVNDHAASATLAGGRPSVNGIALSCRPGGVSFRCEVPELLPGAGVTVTVTVSVPPSTPGGTVCDTARARAAEVEVHPVGNHASACTAIMARSVPVTG
jgi:uncharacterized repeat protein (TIGR01451 family)